MEQQAQKLTDQQMCYVWDEMTALARSATNTIRNVSRSSETDEDYVKATFIQLLDAEYINDWS